MFCHEWCESGTLNLIKVNDRKVTVIGDDIAFPLNILTFCLQFQ